MTHRDITPYQSHKHTHLHTHTLLHRHRQSPFLIHHYCSFSHRIPFPSVFLSLPDSYFFPSPSHSLAPSLPPSVYYSLIFFHSLPLPSLSLLSLFSLLQCCQLAECQGMLISAGRLGPANMAKSKKKKKKKRRKEADREKERGRHRQIDRAVTNWAALKKGNSLRSHVNENDLI